MKNLDYFKTLLLFTFIGLSATACNDDDGHIPMPKPEEAACRLEYIYSDKFNKNDYDEEENPKYYSVKLSYSDKGFVTGIDDNAFRYRGSIEYRYNSSNQVVYASSGTYTPPYRKFEYTNGLLSSYRVYNEADDLDRIISFQYDSKNRIIKEEPVHGYLYSYETSSYITSYNYTYNDEDNLIRVDAFEGDKLVELTILEDYDDNPTPYATIKGLPIGFDIYFLYPEKPWYEYFTKNNPGKKTVYLDRNKDGRFDYDETEEITYTYTYNSKGYPVKITQMGGKYPRTDTFDYACN